MTDTADVKPQMATAAQEEAALWEAEEVKDTADATPKLTEQSVEGPIIETDGTGIEKFVEVTSSESVEKTIHAKQALTAASGVCAPVPKVEAMKVNIVRQETWESV